MFNSNGAYTWWLSEHEEGIPLKVEHGKDFIEITYDIGGDVCKSRVSMENGVFVEY